MSRPPPRRNPRGPQRAHNTTRYLVLIMVGALLILIALGCGTAAWVAAQ